MDFFLKSKKMCCINIPLVIVNPLAPKIPNYAVYCTWLGRPWPSGDWVVSLVSLAPHWCGFESRIGLWILSCEEAIYLDLLAYRMSVVLLRRPLVHEIIQSGTWGLPPSAGKLPYKHYNVDMTLNLIKKYMLSEKRFNALFSHF